MNWFLWSVAVSDVVPDGIREVRCYSLRDLIQAHAVMDAMEAIAKYHRDHPNES